MQSIVKRHLASEDISPSTDVRQRPGIRTAGMTPSRFKQDKTVGAPPNAIAAAVKQEYQGSVQATFTPPPNTREIHRNK
jgi:hypothetical protein